MDLNRLQEVIGYRFENADLLREALTHRSFGQPHNERLEFLGDSVLNCVVSGELFSRYRDLKEGELSRLRAHHVRQESLYRVARKLDLGCFLLLGEGELKSGGITRPSILADAFEALIGAVYLDGGFPVAQSVLRKLLEAPLRENDAESFGKDPKTLLQEHLQGRRLGLPKYSVVSTRGAAHDQEFEVECLVDGLSLRTLGSGSSRRVAEQQAAQRAFEKIVNGR
ncbi:MAG: ribonuclease III [Betaproteobacteria bacterium RIFCSPLOWO2_02_FULL_62_17]|nr:MAG: ribonuclease III [Betaproteobacteria bacterium RIFCSPLOWO2_02_FULL_62_17]